MDLPKNRLNFIYYLFVIVVSLTSIDGQYSVPQPTIEVFAPKGLRVSIPDSPGVQLFAFHGKINEPFRRVGSSKEPGQIDIDTSQVTNSVWIVEDNNTKLELGDIIYYWMYVQNSDLGYRRDQGRWEVKAIKNLDGSITTGEGVVESGSPGSCEPTSTRVNGESTCRGKLIFEDNFDRGRLDIRKWTHESLIPQFPDYEFVSYQRNAENLFFGNEVMYIKPTLLSEENQDFIRSGTLNLTECTGREGSDECVKPARGFHILPPVVSARITSLPSFSFLYGKVEIRAKLPAGDWIYPELYLMPKSYEYGQGYQSGQMMLGLARGNENLLTNEGRDINSRELNGGAVFAQLGPFRSIGIKSTLAPGAGWNNDFHVYSLVWRPDSIIVSVDSKPYGIIQPPPGGFAALGKEYRHRYVDRWQGPLSPFDREFCLVLGVGVGGLTIFPDHSVSGINLKPWKNSGAKRLLQFWEAQDKWYGTWNGNASALQIDYVRVWAL